MQTNESKSGTIGADNQGSSFKVEHINVDFVESFFRNRSIRVAIIDGAFWFAGPDICKPLGFRNHRQAIKYHVLAEYRGVQILDTPSGRQPILCVKGEAALYQLILGSHKEEAQEFKKWVTNDLLPKLRQTGHYELTQPQPMLEAVKRLHGRGGARPQLNRIIRHRDDSWSCRIGHRWVRHVTEEEFLQRLQKTQLSHRLREGSAIGELLMTSRS